MRPTKVPRREDSTKPYLVVKKSSKKASSPVDGVVGDYVQYLMGKLPPRRRLRADFMKTTTDPDRLAGLRNAGAAA
jgi:hypothetical protein